MRNPRSLPQEPGTVLGSRRAWRRGCGGRCRPWPDRRRCGRARRERERAPTPGPAPRGVVDRRRPRRSDRPRGPRHIHATARSVAGSPPVRSPKSSTPTSRPPRATRFPGCRSPWIHTGGPGHDGWARAVAHAAVTAVRSRSAGRSARCASNSSAPLGERHAPVGVAGRIAGRLQVQHGEEPGQSPFQRLLVEGVARRQHRLPLDPPHDRPPPRVAATGLAGPDRHGHLERQPPGQLRQPPQLRLDQPGPERPTGHAHRQVVAEPEDLVVPPAGDATQRPDEVGVLVGDERGDQLVVDRVLRLGAGCRPHGPTLGTAPGPCRPHVEAGAGLPSRPSGADAPPGETATGVPGWRR